MGDRVDASFLLPVDMPLVRSTTIRALIDAFAAQPNGIVHPVFAGRRGHPPLIARALLVEAALDNASGPLSALLAHNENCANEVAVAGQANHMDIDSPA